MAQLNPNGSVAGNAQNIPEAHVPRTRSTFPLKRHFFNTHRFGEYIPHFFADLNKDEDFPINSSHTLRTYTLKSPLMQNIVRNKDYFLVPMESILPLNWEKFFDNPVRGDDVLDDVGPTVENFWSKVYAFFNVLYNSWVSIVTSTPAPSASNLIQASLRFIVLGEYFYSNGNLLSSLGCHGAPYIDVDNPNGVLSYDDFFDEVCRILVENFLVDSSGSYLGSITVQVDNFVYVVSSRSNEFGFDSISFRHLLQLVRDNPTFTVTNVTYSAGLSSAISDLNDIFNDWSLLPANANVQCNLSRLWAYQLSVSHYFTNDHIDFVYSAELYRQLIGHYVRSAVGINNMGSNFFFTRNGVNYQYDYLSARGFNLVISTAGSLSALLTSTASTGAAPSCLGYFSALFGYRRSLRYLDYFTGSRAQPLAVVGTQSGLNGGISTNVAVNANQVSVIDITKSIQAQRFLNSVNRVRHNFEGYLKGIFGGEVPAPDYHNPFKLAHTDDVIFGQETENTATEQMNDKIAITTNLRSNSGNYVFEIHTDRPCIAIGITSYEIARIYTKSMDRSFLHQNRFDWFNPFMQWIGDQPIYIQELGIRPGASSLLTLSNFAYAIRHEEYKQWFHIASGGFGVPSTDLDNWIFVAKDRRGTQANINPDWIRSLNAEFDNFYVSLSGWSLGTYFHFIVDDFNSCKASRPMAFAPQILG